jgi:hypothetical protein
MRRRSWLFVPAFVFATGGGTAAFAMANVNAAWRSNLGPELKCALTSVKIVGSQVVPTGGCKIGTKPAPAAWSWTTKSADLSGAPCQFGTASGRGKSLNLPTAPAGNPGAGSLLLPRGGIHGLR